MIFFAIPTTILNFHLKIQSIQGESPPPHEYIILDPVVLNYDISWQKLNFLITVPFYRTLVCKHKMDGNEIFQVVLIIQIFSYSRKGECVVMYSLPPSDNFPHYPRMKNIIIWKTLIVACLFPNSFIWYPFPNYSPFKVDFRERLRNNPRGHHFDGKDVAERSWALHTVNTLRFMGDLG